MPEGPIQRPKLRVPKKSRTKEQFGEIVDADEFPRLVYPTCISQPKETLDRQPSPSPQPSSIISINRFETYQAVSRAITISTRYIWNAESTSCEYYAMENDAEAEHPARYRKPVRPRKAT